MNNMDENIIYDPNLESQDLLNILLGGKGAGFGSWGLSPMMGMFFSMLMRPSLFGDTLPNVLMPKEKVDEILGMEDDKQADAIKEYVDNDPVCVGLKERSKDKEALARLNAVLSEMDARIEAIKKEKIEVIRKWAVEK